MRIAQIAPLGERVPPEKYGGTERVISTLTEELVNRGHDVTLFASADSQTSAQLISVYPHALRDGKNTNPYGPTKWAMLNIGLAYQMQREFDIIHDHNEYLSLPTANFSKIPVVMTLHGAIDRENRRLYETLTNPYLVTISKAQTQHTTYFNHIGTVYHGLSMRHYPFSEKHDGYMLIVGRISREKGTHIAMDVANTLKMPLIIAAKIDEADRAYFEKEIKPRISRYTKLIGEVDEKKRNKLMSKALCFLHPITWPEPFGLVLIEAPACGCPVIAFNNGSVPEIVKAGVSGCIVQNMREMITAVKKISAIKRLDARSYVLEKFTREHMTDAYEKIYKDVLNRSLKSQVQFSLEQIVYTSDFHSTLKKKYVD